MPISPTGATQQSQSFGIEMRNDYKTVHTSRDTIVRCMDDMADGKNHRSAFGERSGQLRPYVRPVARRSPLAIMGVRLRARHQSVLRAQGPQGFTALPELSS